MTATPSQLRSGGYQRAMSRLAAYTLAMNVLIQVSYPVLLRAQDRQTLAAAGAQEGASRDEIRPVGTANDAMIDRNLSRYLESGQLSDDQWKDIEANIERSVSEISVVVMNRLAEALEDRAAEHGQPQIAYCGPLRGIHSSVGDMRPWLSWEIIATDGSVWPATDDLGGEICTIFVTTRRSPLTIAETVVGKRTLYINLWRVGIKNEPRARIKLEDVLAGLGGRTIQRFLSDLRYRETAHIEE